jgi:hypothetical protein
MIFLRHKEIDRLRNRNSVETIKTLFQRKKFIKRIGFETILSKIKDKTGDD